MVNKVCIIVNKYVVFPFACLIIFAFKDSQNDLDEIPLYCRAAFFCCFFGLLQTGQV